MERLRLFRRAWAVVGKLKTGGLRLCKFSPFVRLYSAHGRGTCINNSVAIGGENLCAVWEWASRSTADAGRTALHEMQVAGNAPGVYVLHTSGELDVSVSRGGS